MEKTNLLNLPYLMPAQAQKHVTHNEALRLLDGIVHISAKGLDTVSPPSDPVEGDRYLLGSSPNGAFAGHDGHIALFADGEWHFLQPQSGWLAYNEAQSNILIHDGTTWAPLGSHLGGLNNLSGLGIGTSSDNTNKFAVSSPASLFNHAGGDHRLVVNKNGTADTGSIIFQNNWTGRAEFGLAGTDDFSVKTSGNGVNWNTAIKIDAPSGVVSFPSGVKAPGSVQISGRWHCFDDLRWVGFSDSYGAATENYNRNNGTGSEPVVANSQLGPFLRQGSQVNGLFGAFRTNSTEITHIDIRLCYQYGPWDGSWTSSASTTRDIIFSQNAMPISADFPTRLDASFATYDCPVDGFIMMFIKPVGAPTATRFVYSSVRLEFMT